MSSSSPGWLSENVCWRVTENSFFAKSSHAAALSPAPGRGYQRSSLMLSTSTPLRRTSRMPNCLICAAICCGTFSSSGVCPRYASSRSDCVAFRNDHSRRVSMASALSMSDGLPQKNRSASGDCAATSAPAPRSSRVDPTSAFSICHSNDCSFVTLVLMPPSPFPSPLRR